MRKAVVFGVTGQDGAYLAQFLLSKGYEVHGVSRGLVEPHLQNLIDLGIQEQVVVRHLSITDFYQVSGFISEVTPDEIYNVAGISSVSPSFERPKETHESIYLGTLNILESIRLADKPIKFFSAGSSECFGDTGGKLADERTPFRPTSPYGVAKAASFWQVSNYRELFGLFACTGILTNHESPLRLGRFVTKKIVSAACRIAGGSEEKLNLGDLSIIRDWGWAPEYVEVMWLMLRQKKADDFVIATGESNSLQAFVAAAFSQLGLDWRDHVVLDKSLLRPVDTDTFRGDTTKAKKILSWSARFKMKNVISMMIQAEQQGAVGP